MKISKVLIIVFSVVTVFIVAGVAFLNWPGKFANGTCLKSEKSHTTLKVESLMRFKGVYFVTVAQSNYSDGSMALGNEMAMNISDLESDSDLKVVECPTK